MNKFEQFFRKIAEILKNVLETIKDYLNSLLSTEEEHTLLKSMSPDYGFEDVELADFVKVTTVPSTFIKTFVYDYVEDIDKKVNTYAEDNEVEIKSILVNQTKCGVLYATVIFERGCE